MCGMMLCSNRASLSCSSTKGVLCDFGPFVMQTSSAGILFPNQTVADSRQFSCSIAVCLFGNNARSRNMVLLIDKIIRHSGHAAGKAHLHAASQLLNCYSGQFIPGQMHLFRE